MGILDDSYEASKYKDILIRNWKQHCERFNDFLIHEDNYNQVASQKTLKEDVNWKQHYFRESCH